MPSKEEDSALVRLTKDVKGDINSAAAEDTANPAQQQTNAAAVAVDTAL